MTVGELIDLDGFDKPVAAARRRPPRKVDVDCEQAMRDGLRGVHVRSSQNGFRAGWAAAIAHLTPRLRELEALLSMIGRWVPAQHGPTLRELTSSVPGERIDEERAAAIRAAADYLSTHVQGDTAGAVEALRRFADRVEIDGLAYARQWAPEDDYTTRRIRRSA